MKGWVGYILLAASLVVGYQGFQNAREDPATETMARSVACDVAGSCVLKTERPSEIRTDVLGRRYQWRSTVGPIAVTCRRELVFFGNWRCSSTKGTL